MSPRKASGPQEPGSSKQTPMMQQYLSVKEAYPGTIVLFRMGDFFETFYEDAETCARLLDITLTARSKEKDPVPMAGVPHHAIDGYLARLVNEHGQTVVLVDQVEDPKEAKGLVRREVTKVFTPGTFIDPHAPSRLASYLVAIAFPASGRKEHRLRTWGLAALDLSTGEFRATSGEEPEQLVDEVLRLSAKEVLIERAAEDDPRLAELASVRGAPARSVVQADLLDAERGILEEVLGAEEARGLEPLLAPEALRAARMALVHAKHTQLRDESFERKRGGSFAHVNELKPYLPSDALVLDTECRTHLELFRAADGGKVGSLLETIDAAVTSLGGRLLARWLSRPLIDPAQIDGRLDAVEALLSAPSVLDEVRQELAEVYDLERLLGRVAMARANPRDLEALRASLERVPTVLEAVRQGATEGPRDVFDALPSSEARSRIRSTLLMELARTEPCSDVLEWVSEAIVEEPPAEIGKGRVFRSGYDPRLDELYSLFDDGKDVLAELERREREQTGISSLKVKHNRVFGYFIEVTKSNLSAVPEHYIRKQTMVNGERYYTQELKELEERIVGAEERKLRLETELFSELVRRIGDRLRRLQSLADALAQIDVLAGFAHVAERRGYCRPKVDTSGLLEIEDGRHPVIESLSEALGEPFVPNDLAIGSDFRLMIITGPNMAGKSTIMRQTALITILAQMGAFVPAKSARIGVVDRIFTRVGASDDLSKGRSTFMVEMTETARILRSATERSLILLDEIGRGTSTFDGLSIAWAVAEHLHDEIRAKCLFATHYHELTELCRDKSEARNFHVSVKEWNEQIVFLRKLVEGPTNRSYGVQVARLAGLPLPVVERARKVLASLEAQDLSAGDHSVASRALAVAHGEQLHLFAAGTRLMPPELEAIIEELEALAVDETTPRQALERLAEWQARLAARTPKG